MPLYRVQITYEAVVEAPNHEVAIRRARSAEVFFDCERQAVCHEITSTLDLPPSWTPECTPYGSDDTTIRGILKHTEQRMRDENERSAGNGV